MTVKPWTFVGSLAAAATLSLATSGFGQCGTGGDCCAANPGPFCSDVTCCEQVCAADPFCCDTQWDQVCADTAAGVCEACGATTCPVDCSSANAQEDEFCGDDTNGGCNSGGTLFTPAALGDIFCGNYWADANTRDTDWYEFTLAENTVVNLSLVGSASIGSALGLLDANCPPGVLAFATSTPGNCTPLEINGTCLVAGTYRIFVGAANFNGVPCDLQASYLLSIIDTGETCTGPENDECAGALPIGIGDTSFDTTGSISNTSIPDCNFFGSTTWNKDLWYSFTPDVDGLYRLTTCGQADFDTKIAVFDGCGGNVVGCNDDGAGCPGFTSDLLVPLTAGTAYKITIGGFGTATGTGVLTVAQIEACDTTCDKAAHQEQEICGEDTNGGCNGGIGNEYIGLNRTVCGTFWAEGGTRDTDWFEFDLLEPAVVTMTAQSTLNVTIGLLTNTCPPTIYEIDATQSCGATISACLPAGSSVAFIARAGFDDPACGSGDLNSYTFTLSVGETCEPPACGVKSAGSCCEPHENPYCSDATCCELICSADPFCCNTEWDQICADQAVGQCEACGATPPPNDDCSGAIAITTGLTPFDTAGAGSDTDAGAGCVFLGSSLINNDVWFKYTATQNADITVATCGLTTLDTKVAIFLNCGDRLQRRQLRLAVVGDLPRHVGHDVLHLARCLRRHPVRLRPAVGERRRRRRPDQRRLLGIDRGERRKQQLLDGRLHDRHQRRIDLRLLQQQQQLQRRVVQVHRGRQRDRDHRDVPGHDDGHQDGGVQRLRPHHRARLQRRCHGLRPAVAGDLHPDLRHHLLHLDRCLRRDDDRRGNLHDPAERRVREPGRPQRRRLGERRRPGDPARRLGHQRPRRPQR
jgi:hypothetical protein